MPVADLTDTHITMAVALLWSPPLAVCGLSLASAVSRRPVDVASMRGDEVDLTGPGIQ